TYPPGLPRQPMAGALGQYLRLFRDRFFMGHVLTGALCMAGMFAYITGSPFVFIELYGVKPEHFGWLFGINAAGFILMAQVNVRLVRWRGPEFWVRRWVWFFFASALALLAVAAAQPESLWPLLIPLFCCVSCLGCLLPNATACAMADQRANAGSASALLGSLQFTIAAIAASAVGALHNGTAVPLAAIMSLCGLLATLVAYGTARASTE
ncbi:MAG TPA: Bcr/CflA family drug resistance efflux transporter, partial [Pseudomonas sp.]|nr:Bcr/CflA family drug resistance efflux transporter [Pseudomonas sp.]